jgi:mRNA-degrading endonuclease YafQ of YafQ-DinJ toxin-antitoxin module
MKALFETAFMKGVRKHPEIKKRIEQKVKHIMERPVEMGEPLKGNLRGFYSCPVKRNFIIIYLYCAACRKKRDSGFVGCADCSTTPDDTIKFVMLGPHDNAYTKARGRG